MRVERSDKKSREYVLFAAPSGRAATEEVRELWHAERLPPGGAAGLQEELIKRKLRTKEELAARHERKAAARRRAQELASQPKKARTGQIRTWANTHLGDAAELDALTRK